MISTEAERLVRYLKDAYPRDRWSPDRMRIYTLEMADLDATAAGTAIREWVRAREYPPSIADIRRDARNVAARADMPGAPDVVDPQVASNNFRKLHELMKKHAHKFALPQGQDDAGEAGRKE